MASRSVRYFSTSRGALKDVFILSSVRTAVGAFQGSLASLTAPELGVIAANAAVERAGVKKSDIEEVYFGNVLQGGVGQAPARQVVIKGGFPESVEATTINKVCASGLKTVSIAANAIRAGDRDIVLAGGMESMSNSPYYVSRGLKYGNSELKDAIVHDGFTDVYDKILMGSCCENTNKREGITREDQDKFASESYQKALDTIKNGGFKDEIVPVVIKGRKGETVFDEDESPKAIKFDKIPTLRAAFEKNGTVTAANASSINDGAAAFVIASGEKVKELGANVVAKVIAYADAATAPIDFTIAPSLAIPKALERAGLTKDNIAKFEINEAFSGVAIANQRILDLDSSKINVKGGAVAIGHPIGASGARILVTLIHNLKEGEYGVAAICNGGGAATAVVIQKASSA